LSRPAIAMKLLIASWDHWRPPVGGIGRRRFAAESSV
jgi:hypothetical protein